MCTAYNDRYGLEVIGLRYMNVYGPDKINMRCIAVLFQLCLIKLMLTKHPQSMVMVQAYDFIYVEDVARCNVAALKSSTKYGFYNVGT